MAARIEITDTLMRFGYSHKDQLSIDKWEDVVEERIFAEQIRPDSKLTRQMPDVVADMKKRAEREGIKKPYSGTFGRAKAVEFGFKGRMVYVRSVSFKDEPFEITNRNGKIKTPVNDKSHIYVIEPEDIQRFNTWRDTDEGRGQLDEYAFTFWSNSVGDGLIITNKKTDAKLDLSKYENF
jgi:hypothetical protein